MSEDIGNRIKADTPREQRNWMLWGWLALVVIYNLFVIFSLLRGGSDPNLGYVTDEGPLGASALPLALIGRGAIVLSAVVLAVGYRIGFYGMALAFVVTVIGSLLIGFNIGSLVEAGLVMLVAGVLVRGMWHRLK
jgi:hypothetical protein